MQHVMLQTARTIHIPKALSYEIFYFSVFLFFLRPNDCVFRFKREVLIAKSDYACSFHSIQGGMPYE